MSATTNSNAPTDLLDLLQRKEPELMEYFCEVYGKEAFIGNMLAALHKKTSYSCLVNKFANLSLAMEVLKKEEKAQLEQAPEIESICLYSTHFKAGEYLFPEPIPDERNLKIYYCLDLASVLATQALDIQPDDDVLDMCAAPGGKSLAILQRLNWEGGGGCGSLHLNEPNDERRKRLRIVVDSHIPHKIVTNHIRFTGADASHYGAFDEDSYDKVLVDAPCSSERHLIQDAEHGSHAFSAQNPNPNRWTAAKSKNLAKKQIQMLLNALRAVRPGGRVVYATCSINPTENDGVVRKALQKTKSTVLLLRRSWKLPGGSPTDLGWMLLPNADIAAAQWGPIYFCILQRTK